MQMSAPEATDVTSESDATKKLYGLDDPISADFGGRCLLARRLVERGVRFVQVWSGNGMNATDWDGHIQNDKNHQARAAQTDKAVGGLLADLKSRGLLDSTLVIWGAEFGRSPTRTEGPAARTDATIIRMVFRFDGRRWGEGRPASAQPRTVCGPARSGTFERFARVHSGNARLDHTKSLNIPAGIWLDRRRGKTISWKS
jgi:hypothetical protein